MRLPLLRCLSSAVLPLAGSALLAHTVAAQSASAVDTSKPIQITADFRDTPRRLFHAEIDLPVKGGTTATFTTPKWIPGNHRPTGPVDQITGVVFTANGQTLKWRRDDEELYEFHVEVPKGVTSVHVHLDCITTARVSAHMGVLEWERVMMYPAHIPVREIPIQPTVIVPAGWGIGTALTPTDPGYTPEPASGAPKGGTVHFAPTNVEQLEDSPVISGQYFHEFALAPEMQPKHYIDVVADAPEDAQLRPELLKELNHLIQEADAAYASHHYNQYHFLLTLSDVAGGEGLEHGQSSDNGVGEKGFSEATHQIPEAELLPHEFTHSWNGKYRRPFNLYQTDFSKMQQGSLLWVYEGMTQYMGNVLAARAGLDTQAEYRDMLAMSAASLDYRPGREWRSTEDTAIAASILRGGNPAWSNWRRGQDYYQEGELLWLDADTLIRQKTNGAKSLTDFHHIFLAKGGNTGPLIVTYTFDELVHDLNQVLPYDWATFLHQRVSGINPHADLAGIERGGYRLVYKDEPNPTQKKLMSLGSRRGGAGVDAWYSVGLRLGKDGEISDVRWNGPADKAQLAPGFKVLAVNGQAFSPDAMRDGIKAAKGTSEPIHFLVQDQEMVRSVNVDYHDGERYPVLERISGTTAYLDQITTPLVAARDAAPAAEATH